MMCRLYASIDHAPAARTHQLLDAPNSLRAQARDHADGWGVAWFAPDGPQLRRSTALAHGDNDFEQAVRDASGRLVMAHIRRASVGVVNMANTHPFTDGRWVFAHNGTVPGFERIRAELENRCDARYRDDLRGDTDSERLFGLFRTQLDGLETDHGGVIRALQQTVDIVVSLCRARDMMPSLNLLVSDGGRFAVTRLGRSLYVRRPEAGGVVISSEPDGISPGWRRVPNGALLLASLDGTVVQARAI